MLGNPLKEILQNLHRFFNINQPVVKGIYAVERGDYIGEFFVYIKTLKSGDHCFLSLPKMQKRIIPEKSFYNGIKNKIMVFVEKLPNPVYQLCRKQYERLLNNNSSE